MILKLSLSMVSVSTAGKHGPLVGMSASQQLSMFSIITMGNHALPVVMRGHQ